MCPYVSVCVTAHTILTSANEIFDRELSCVYTVVNGLGLASRALSINCVSRLCYLLILSKSCFNIFFLLQVPSRYEMLLTFFITL